MATATATSKIDSALERVEKAQAAYDEALDKARQVGAEARQAEEDAIELEALVEMGQASSKDATKARNAADKATKKVRVHAKVIDMHQQALEAAERDVRELREQAEAEVIADRHAAVREFTQQFADLVVGAEKALLAVNDVFEELKREGQPLPHRKLHVGIGDLVYDRPHFGGVYATFLKELREFGYRVDR